VGFSKEADEQKADSSAPALLTSTPAPWAAYSTTYDRSAPPFVRLHNEILDCCEYIAPSVEEMRTREVVLAEVTEVVTSLWPTATISVFGSQMTKILTPTSDLDLVAVGVPSRGDSSQPYMLLAEALKSSGIVSYVEAIVNAKVPIVKLDHKLSGISVDICINNDSGLRTGKMIRRFVRQFPPLRPMVLVLKLFLVSSHTPTHPYFYSPSLILPSHTTTHPHMLPNTTTNTFPPQPFPTHTLRPSAVSTTPTTEASAHSS
jgi:DNA polymerase sigma